jgi:hypothetical protein
MPCLTAIPVLPDRLTRGAPANASPLFASIPIVSPQESIGPAGSTISSVYASIIFQQKAVTIPYLFQEPPTLETFHIANLHNRAIRLGAVRPITFLPFMPDDE